MDIVCMSCTELYDNLLDKCPLCGDLTVKAVKKTNEHDHVKHDSVKTVKKKK